MTRLAEPIPHSLAPTIRILPPRKVSPPRNLIKINTSLIQTGQDRKGDLHPLDARHSNEQPGHTNHCIQRPRPPTNSANQPRQRLKPLRSPVMLNRRQFLSSTAALGVGAIMTPTATAEQQTEGSERTSTSTRNTAPGQTSDTRQTNMRQTSA